MKKKINFTSLKRIDLSGVDINESMFNDSIDRTKINKAVGYDVVKKYIESKKELKKIIIDSLNECDDFSITYSSDSYWGDECILETFKVEVESEEELEKRKKATKAKSKKAAETRRKNKEKKEKEEYERLKKKFEK